jgi:hypothetical protein
MKPCSGFSSISRHRGAINLSPVTTTPVIIYRQTCNKISLPVPQSERSVKIITEFKQQHNRIQQNMKKLPISNFFSFIADVIDTGD